MGGEKAGKFIPSLKKVLNAVYLQAVKVYQLFILIEMEIDNFLAFDLMLRVDELYHFVLLVADGDEKLPFNLLWLLH